MKKSQVGLILFFTVALFMSCDKFLEGSDLKDEINKMVDYGNSPSVAIKVQGDDNAIKFLSGQGEVSLKKNR